LINRWKMKLDVLKIIGQYRDDFPDGFLSGRRSRGRGQSQQVRMGVPLRRKKSNNGPALRFYGRNCWRSTMRFETTTFVNC
jgi:hypothetical protein